MSSKTTKSTVSPDRLHVAAPLVKRFKALSDSDRMKLIKSSGIRTVKLDKSPKRFKAKGI